MRAKVREHASGLVWVRSSYSSEEGGECVEVAVSPHVVHVRDSKDIARRGFAVDEAAWTAFVGFAVR
ncbi:MULTISPECIES: DUF397 domain-containing protein [Streptomyces violaceoruber group]|uniref:DUF397 domain-containing protein n=1 Tax=Streptomyces violaceoruber TaxID=1935 RepID=A0ACD4WJR7_STRVN|nr:DUF397 domain-containing protein [Streptomyces violaceoruber]BDD75525.1 hypothetical protein JCM4020_61450 [Streptomyces coelicolor]